MYKEVSADIQLSFGIICLGSLPLLSVETIRCPSCVGTSQVAMTTSPPSCLVAGSQTKAAPLLLTTTLPSSTPPASNPL